MAQTVQKLTALKVAKRLPPGMYADGAGLYLQVTGDGAKSWIFRFSLRGRAREMGLGAVRNNVGLSEARTKAAKCRVLLENHIDPIESRKRERAEAALANEKQITFKEAAATYIASHRAGWRNPKHAAQWPATLADYAEPVLGKLLVSDITTDLVHRVLEPIWTAKPQTAGRVRSRIESILDWARVSGYRSGENPARWRGNLDQLLPKLSKVQKVKHHAALPYDDLPAFMRRLRQQDGAAARLLEFCILTASRTGESLEARPAEINRSEKLWIVPAERMKGGKEHRIPLCPRAMELIEDASERYLFPHPVHPDRSLRNKAMLKVLELMGRDDVTVHGFRSSFKDWARDHTRFDNYAVEAALAHTSGDKVEAAYARSDVLDKRRRLMDAWADFCANVDRGDKGETDNVVALRSS